MTEANGMLAQVERNLHLEQLDESTLSRVWKHTSDPNTAFAMLSASRGERTEEENVRANISLAADIRNAGFGYFWLYGHTIENEGQPGERKVSEDSLFVIGSANQSEEMKQVLLDLAKEYGQDSIFFKPAGSDKGMIISSDGSIGPTDLVLRPDQMGTYYSQLKKGSHAKRPFKFESAGTASSGISKWAKRLKAK